MKFKEDFKLQVVSLSQAAAGGIEVEEVTLRPAPCVDRERSVVPMRGTSARRKAERGVVSNCPDSLSTHSHPGRSRRTHR